MATLKLVELTGWVFFKWWLKRWRWVFLAGICVTIQAFGVYINYVSQNYLLSIIIATATGITIKEGINDFFKIRNEMKPIGGIGKIPMGSKTVTYDESLKGYRVDYRVPAIEEAGKEIKVLEWVLKYPGLKPVWYNIDKKIIESLDPAELRGFVTSPWHRGMLDDQAWVTGVIRNEV
jgi:hypothetical protein